MARKNEQKKKGGEPTVPEAPKRRIKDEALAAVYAIASFVLAIFLFFSAYAKGGVVGNFVYHYLDLLFGRGYFLAPIVALLFGFSFLDRDKPRLVSNIIGGGVLALMGGLGLVELLFPANGGFVGKMLAGALEKLFGVYVSATALGALIVVAVVIMFDNKLSLEPVLFGKRLWGRGDDEEALPPSVEEPIKEMLIRPQVEPEAPEATKPAAPKGPTRLKISESEKADDITVEPRKSANYTPPPLSLLEKDSGKPGVGDIKANANIIKRTLANFGIDVEMDEISIGPTVTRYAMKPAEGVKLSRISGLQDNLALALAAHPLRIEAPIPGKSLVGIEIPNTSKTTVGLGTLLSSREFQESNHPLFCALGKGISGLAHFANLSKAPHMLIAGATGSGKSVTIQSIIVSLLYRNSPEMLRFIMIDPKRVELTLYNGIPHLLTPVITDAKKAILSLKWAAKEMERRYGILEQNAVRDIGSYQKNNPNSEPMPYIVIIIDELADIMTTYPRELEAAIVRLAQMSRAVGIHLVLSTQRPSVEVITGLIKANVPSRIALQVPSQIDSRTIIDMPGAEKLLGAGDMLYLGGDMAKPARIQSTYVSEAEVKNVVKFLKDHSEEIPPSELNLTGQDNSPNAMFSATIDGEGGVGDSDDEDELFEEARQLVVSSGKASTSYLQRRLKVGYARAARLIDILEERGVVGPGDGAKPREVYGLKTNGFGETEAQTDDIDESPTT